MPKWMPPASCKLWLPGQDDPQSATIRDRSGNGNNGTIVGATWIRTGKGLWYLDFDGTDDYWTAGAVGSFSFIQNTKIFTVEFWAYLADHSTGLQAFLANTQGGSNQKGFFIYNSGGGQIIFQSYDGSGGANRPNNLVSSAGFISDANWHHYIFTSNGTTGAIYKDGVADTPATNTLGTPSTGNSTYVLYGGGYPGTPIDGDVDGGMALNKIKTVATSASQASWNFQQERHFFGV